MQEKGKWKKRGLKVEKVLDALPAMTADRDRWRQTAQDLAGKLTEVEKERDALQDEAIIFQDDVVRLKERNKQLLEVARVAEEKVRKIGELLGC